MQMNFIVNAFTVDVEDYYQVEAFSQHIQRSHWNNLRGSINLTALASITNYSESNLDSKGEDITLDYFYPYSEIMSMTQRFVLKI